MEEPLPSPPPPSPASENRPETPAERNRRDEEVRGCFVICALIVGTLAFSVMGPIGVWWWLFWHCFPFTSFVFGFFIRAETTGTNNTASRPVGVPRRFGVGSLLVVTAAFAILLGAMKSLQVDPIVMGLVAAFIAVVGAGQAVLFGGKAPRKASMVAGMLFPLVVGFLVFVYAVVARGRLSGFEFGEFFVNIVLLCVLGMPLGYVAGGLAAGVFLAIERVWGRSKDED